MRLIFVSRSVSHEICQSIDLFVSQLNRQTDRHTEERDFNATKEPISPPSRTRGVRRSWGGGGEGGSRRCQRCNNKQV